MTRGITEPPLLSVDSSTPAFLEMGEWLKSSAQSWRSTDVLNVPFERLSKWPATDTLLGN
jgi:hypothetical protein